MLLCSNYDKLSESKVITKQKRASLVIGAFRTPTGMLGSIGNHFEKKRKN